MCNDRTYKCPDSSDELGIVRDSLRVETQLIDQIYERNGMKGELVCASCRHVSRCDEKAKQAAFDNGNECHSSCW